MNLHSIVKGRAGTLIGGVPWYPAYVFFIWKCFGLGQLNMWKEIQMMLDLF